MKKINQLKIKIRNGWASLDTGHVMVTGYIALLIIILVLTGR
jgi:hypothetical protein